MHYILSASKSPLRIHLHQVIERIWKMNKPTLESLGDIFQVIHCGHYVVLIGKYLWILRDNGDLIAHKKDIVNPAHTLYLSEDRLLVECGKQKVFILISLKTGAELLRVPMPNYDLMVCEFVLSPDKAYIYSIYERKGIYYFQQINTQDWTCSSFPLQQRNGALSDIICDANGVLCILESCYQMIGDNHISENGIRYIRSDDIMPGSAFYWKSKWTLPFPHAAFRFILNAETILTNHLWLYNVSDGTTTNLLENETRWQLPPESLSDARFAYDGKYIILTYLRRNVVLDVQAKKVVAEYAADFKLGFLIGDKFWLPGDTGVKRKDFPAFEEIPPQKHKFW